MRNILIALAALAAVPFMSQAATYHYVNNDGVTDTVEASSAAEALATAPNIASNSGVALDAGLIEPGTVVLAAAIDTAPNTGASQFGTGGSNTYHYVTNDGVTASVQAPNPETAIAVAPNRASNSGVAIDDGTLESGEEVESVAN